MATGSWRDSVESMAGHPRPGRPPCLAGRQCLRKAHRSPLAIVAAAPPTGHRDLDRRLGPVATTRGCAGTSRSPNRRTWTRDLPTHSSRFSGSSRAAFAPPGAPAVVHACSAANQGIRASACTPITVKRPGAVRCSCRKGHRRILPFVSTAEPCCRLGSMAHLPRLRCVTRTQAWNRMANLHSQGSQGQEPQLHRPARNQRGTMLVMGLLLCWGSAAT